MRKGQVALAIPIILIVLVAIGAVVFLLTQVKQPPGPSVTNPGLVYVGDSPVSYVEDTQATDPDPDAETVFETILANAGLTKEGAGPVADGPLFHIGWVGGPDVFMVEVKSTDFDAAKAAAEKWFVDQGLQLEDLCRGIAVTFFISPSVRGSVPAGTEFNPNPSCR